MAAVTTTWKWRARAETSGTTVNVAGLAIAVLQLETTRALRVARGLKETECESEPESRGAPSVEHCPSSRRTTSSAAIRLFPLGNGHIGIARRDLVLPSRPLNRSVWGTGLSVPIIFSNLHTIYQGYPT